MATATPPVEGSRELQGYTAKEQERIADLMRLMPQGRASALEIGARGGYFTKMLLNHFQQVTALDLEKPDIAIPGVTPVQGDVTSLGFPDQSFDVVVCTEVLEHIPPAKLAQACAEIQRVARYELVVGVPYRQDLRVDRTRCPHCGRRNPPWGHFNSFDRAKLARLLDRCRVREQNFVSQEIERTNPLSAWLMDLAGNPWGAYGPGERCGFCGTALAKPPEVSAGQKALALAALALVRLQTRLASPRPIWLHTVFAKLETPAA